MHLLKKKLNSNNGASMILALALVLICVMVSSVIVAAAASGTSRNAQRVEQQQSYLAISSAADLLYKELSLEANYVGTESKTEYGCIQDCVEDAEIAYIINGEYVLKKGKRLDSKYIWGPLDEAHLLIEKTHDTSVSKGTDDIRSFFNGELVAGLLERSAAAIYGGEAEYVENIVITLEGEEERLPSVNCEFTMDQNYDVSIQLTTSSSSYSMLIWMPAKEPDVQEESLVVHDSDMHEVYYKCYQDGGEFSGTFVDQLVERGIDITVTTIITTVDWDTPIIKKGVLADE